MKNVKGNKYQLLSVRCDKHQVQVENPEDGNDSDLGYRQENTRLRETVEIHVDLTDDTSGKTVAGASALTIPEKVRDNCVLEAAAKDVPHEAVTGAETLRDKNSTPSSSHRISGAPALCHGFLRENNRQLLGCKTSESPPSQKHKSDGESQQIKLQKETQTQSLSGSAGRGNKTHLFSWLKRVSLKRNKRQQTETCRPDLNKTVLQHTDVEDNTETKASKRTRDKTKVNQEIFQINKTRRSKNSTENDNQKGGAETRAQIRRELCPPKNVVSDNIRKENDIIQNEITSVVESEETCWEASCQAKRKQKHRERRKKRRTTDVSDSVDSCNLLLSMCCSRTMVHKSMQWFYHLQKPDSAAGDGAKEGKTSFSRFPFHPNLSLFVSH